jgi:hypothetical protein
MNCRLSKPDDNSPLRTPDHCKGLLPHVTLLKLLSAGKERICEAEAESE